MRAHLSPRFRTSATVSVRTRNPQPATPAAQPETVLVQFKPRGASGRPFGPGWNGRARAEATPPTPDQATPDAPEASAASALSTLRHSGGQGVLTYAEQHARVEGRELKQLLRSKHQLAEAGVPEAKQLVALASDFGLTVKGVRGALKRARGDEDEAAEQPGRLRGRPRLLSDEDVEAAAAEARKVPQKQNWFRAALGALKKRGVVLARGQQRTLRRRLKEIGFRPRPQDVYPELTPQVRPCSPFSAFLSWLLTADRS